MNELPDDWSEAQNALFTKVYKFITANPGAFQHPRAAALPAEHWQTIAHNAAYCAAELLENDSLRVLDADTEELIAASPERLNS